MSSRALNPNLNSVCAPPWAPFRIEISFSCFLVFFYKALIRIQFSALVVRSFCYDFKLIGIRIIKALIRIFLQMLLLLHQKEKRYRRNPDVFSQHPKLEKPMRSVVLDWMMDVYIIYSINIQCELFKIWNNNSQQKKGIKHI